MTDQRIIFKANNQKKSMKSKTACLDHQPLKASGKCFGAFQPLHRILDFIIFKKLTVRRPC